jgi:hypothetical protein
MDWRRPVFDPNVGDFTDRSGFRFSPLAVVRAPGDLTVFVGGPTECWANKLFMPIDFVVRRAVFPVDPFAIYHGPRSILRALGSPLFWFVLVMPALPPLLILRTRNARAWTSLSLALAGSLFYCFLLLLPESTSAYSWVFRAAALGFLVLAAMLIESAKLILYAPSRARVIVVPITLATFAGTLSLASRVWLGMR